MAIDANVSLLDLYFLSRQANDPFDELPFWIIWIAENDDIPPLRGVEAVNELVDSQALATVQIGFHAGTLDAKILDKDLDQEEDSYGEEYRLDDLAQGRSKA